jgi:polar amino acid transport system permease protein
MLNMQLLIEYLPSLTMGTIKTIQIALFSCMCGIAGGMLLGLAQAYAPRWITRLIMVVTALIKGTPMLIQITFAFFLLPQIGITLSAFWTAIFAIGLNSSAYLSSVIYAGITAVAPGQIEAAHVLGFSKWQTVRYIVLPQALSIVFPALGNEFVTLVKDSSLASIIGVAELAKEASVMRSRTYDVITTYTLVALIYLVLTGVITLLMNYWQKRIHRVAD